MEIIGLYIPWEPPHEISDSGVQQWYKDGKKHREDGPAVIYTDGDQYWYKDDKLHHEDGPAVIYSDGDQFWYIHNVDITDDVNEWAEQCNIDLDNMSDSDKLLLKIFISGL